jgi:hypothetical protein
MENEKKITQEMLEWPCDFQVTVDGFSFKEDKAFKLTLGNTRFVCKDMKLRDLMGESEFGTFGGNSFRVKLASRMRAELKSQAQADAWKKVIEKVGVDVNGLLGKAPTRIADPTVWAAGKTKAEIEAKIRELEAMAK